MANEMEKSTNMDNVEKCIKDIEKRGNDIINNTKTVQSDLIKLLNERQSRDQNSIGNSRVRNSLRMSGNATSSAMFRPGRKNLHDIKDIFGDVFLTCANDSVSLKSIRSFDCEQIPIVSLIIPSDKSNAWICDDYSNFHQINSRGVVQKSLVVDFQVEHAARQGRELIMSSFDLLTVKRVQEDETIKAEMSSSPLFPLGIHVTEDGDICICFVEKFDYSITTKSRRLVMLYHPAWLIPTTLEYERGNRIFTIPNRVTSLKKNVIVVDVQSKNKSRIVGVSRDSRVLFEYTRPESKQFCPLDVCTTSNEEIFVLDEFTQAILVLNTNGKLIATVLLSEFCISQPSTMAFDYINSRLWIGHSVNKVSLLAVGDLSENESADTEEEEEEDITNMKTEDTRF